MVGALPVGIETRGTADAPYWPNQSCWTYKEVWSQPAGEWIWLMRDLSGPAVVAGTAEASGSPVQLVNQKTAIVFMATLDANGNFRAAVPQGRYTVQQDGVHITLHTLAAGSYHLDLRRASAVDFTVDATVAAAHKVVLHLAANGAGSHAFSIRVDNLELLDPESVKLDLGSHGLGEIRWRARLIDPHSPWVAVVLADGSLERHQELSGVEATK
jgi:hypothetical protein